MRSHYFVDNGTVCYASEDMVAGTVLQRASFGGGYRWEPANGWADGVLVYDVKEGEIATVAIAGVTEVLLADAQTIHPGNLLKLASGVRGRATKASGALQPGEVFIGSTTSAAVAQTAGNKTTVSTLLNFRLSDADGND